MTELTGIEALKQIRDVKDGEAVQVLRRLWEGDLDVVFSTYNYSTNRDVCAYCEQPWTHYYLKPNEYKGKNYIGHRCEHAEDCIVGTIERLIGVHQINPDVKVVTEDGSIER